jgi:hypothetical protein
VRLHPEPKEDSEDSPANAHITRLLYGQVIPTVNGVYEPTNKIILEGIRTEGLVVFWSASCVECKIEAIKGEKRITKVKLTNLEPIYVVLFCS